MVKCKYCRKEVSKNKWKKIFCNSSCAASFNNKGIVRNRTEGKYAVKKCLNCEKETVNFKFCSNKCFWEDRIKQIWRGIEKTGYLNHDKKTNKKYLIHIRESKCEICGITEWLKKPVLLLMDHIDGDSDNNRLDNVRLICSNCDATLSTYKSRNRGNGRDSIRQRYRQTRFANGSCN